MDKFRSIIAALLLAVWLPATLHCAMEAAGLDDWFGCHEAAHNDADHCADDACHAIEGLISKPDAQPLKISAPLAVALPDSGIFAFVQLCPSLLLASLHPPDNGVIETGAAPPEIARTWHFVVRAAPPSRAPCRAS